MRRTEPLPATQQQLLEPRLQDLEVMAKSSALNALQVLGKLSLFETRMDEEEGDAEKDRPADPEYVDPEIPYYGD